VVTFVGEVGKFVTFWHEIFFRFCILDINMTEM